MDTSTADFLVEMQEYLERVAVSLHCKYYPQADVEDILQDMNVWILDKLASDPELLHTHSRGWFSKGAAWDAMHKLRKQFTYVHNGERIPRTLALDDVLYPPTDDVAEAWDTAIDVGLALETMTGRQAQIAELLMQGYRKGEIAQALGIAAQTVSGHVKGMQAHLTV